MHDNKLLLIENKTSYNVTVKFVAQVGTAGNYVETNEEVMLIDSRSESESVNEDFRRGITQVKNKQNKTKRKSHWVKPVTVHTNVETVTGVQ